MFFGLLINTQRNNFEYGVKAVNQFNDRIETASGSQLFSGRANIILNDWGALVLVNLEVLFPPIHYLFGLFVVGTLFFGFYKISIVMACMFSLLVFLRTKYFYAWLFKKGLRKAGYDDKVRFL